MSYTIEDFQIEMQNAETPEEMTGVIDKLLDSDIDVSNPEIKEMILEYRAQIEDYRNDMLVEDDRVINEWIESGKCELYICKKSISSYNEGERYYVKVNDDRSDYFEHQKDVMDRLQPAVIERMNSILPVFFIISDDGIGTLKKYEIFSKKYNFEDYFEKI